jgi:universal stress protein E
MRSIRRIVVAVKDTRKSSAAMLKAARLAKAFGAKLELFHAIAEPLALDVLAASNIGIESFKKTSQERHTKSMERLAAKLRQGGLQVDVAAEWDYPAHEAVVRRARRCRADMIVAEQHATHHAAPWLLRYTDWELLRQSPVPVLLVKSRRAYRNPGVLATVDPSHAFAKTSGLDNEILRAGAALSDALRGKLHVLHAYTPSIIGMDPSLLNVPGATQMIVEKAKKDAQVGLAKAVRTARIGEVPPKRCHLAGYHAVDAIPDVARKNGCDIVVMGALSRSGLKRALIGNTAERLLEDLSCDVLVVKPPRFATHVARKSRGPKFIMLMRPSGMF